ncbi:4-diphosphocytidyl-2-C-methyl-D-erythritol kinase [uncultured Gammaproteobacteria bacterium]
MSATGLNAAEIVEHAPAKLNLYLHVLGRRDNGYHELDSLAAFATVGDAVTVREAVAFSLVVEGPFAPALTGALATEPPGGNLVARAARLLAERLGRPAAVAITLTKVLPVASGIGGGSADAAACLRALARLWGLAVNDPLLFELAPKLGADVPVCLAGRSTYFGGIGEILDPAPPLPPCHVVLVNPGLPLATPAVFKARQGPFSQPGRLDATPRDARHLAELLAKRTNDLMPPALTLAPVIGEVLAALATTPGCLLARLSGSGATCFGLYADSETATAAAAAISVVQPEWWVRPSSLLRA